VLNPHRIAKDPKVKISAQIMAFIPVIIDSYCLRVKEA
jgi:hypothetical protein